MVEAQFRTRLLAVSAIATAVGTRFVEGSKPQGSQYPCITFQRSSTVFPYSHQGKSKIGHVRFGLSVWAKSPTDARAIAKLITDAIETFDLSKLPATPTLTSSPNRLLNQFADEWPDPEPTIYRERLDLRIWFTE